MKKFVILARKKLISPNEKKFLYIFLKKVTIFSKRFVSDMFDSDRDFEYIHHSFMC